MPIPHEPRSYLCAICSTPCATEEIALLCESQEEPPLEFFAGDKVEVVLEDEEPLQGEILGSLIGPANQGVSDDLYLLARLFAFSLNGEGDKDFIINQIMLNHKHTRYYKVNIDGLVYRSIAATQIRKIEGVTDE